MQLLLLLLGADDHHFQLKDSNLVRLYVAVFTVKSFPLSRQLVAIVHP